MSINTPTPIDCLFSPLSQPQKQALDLLPVIWVRTQEALNHLIDEIDGIDRVALDTEFIKRTTYFPILALVQVNTGRAIYLLDAPCLDLTCFWQALVEIPQMIWYACGEDLGIFYLLAKCPALTNVIDVQLAVAYLTGELQIGYARAIEACLGISLPKSESQSDWQARPLSAEQEQYAVDDVRYLFALWDKLHQQLNDKNLTHFVLEDCGLYAQELHKTHNTKDECLYQDFVAPLYTHEQITVLQAIIAWREFVARSTNQPRTFIIGKQPLREIIENLPTNLKALSHTTLNRASLRLYGNEIVAVIKDAKALPVSKRPPMPRPIYLSKDKPFKNTLKTLLAKYSKTSHIPENLLLKGRWLDEILYAVATDSTPSHPALQGYRKDLIQTQIIPMLKEHKTIIRQAMALE